MDSVGSQVGSIRSQVGLKGYQVLYVDCVGSAGFQMACARSMVCSASSMSALQGLRWDPLWFLQDLKYSVGSQVGSMVCSKKVSVGLDWVSDGLCGLHRLYKGLR